MKRKIITIDDNKCDGCGICVEGCMEGALQIIDGKARLISELYCDGLGACIGECPQGAITMLEKEAEPYNEKAVMEKISKQGEKTIIAHLKHLKEHNQMEYFNEGIKYIKENDININLEKLNSNKMFEIKKNNSGSQGCPGSKIMDFRQKEKVTENETYTEQLSELRQWPVQLHLINPQASYFQNADVILAADCVAFSLGNFHSKFLKGKSLAIACPKLDSNMEIYTEKIRQMVNYSDINTLTVMIMEVPCCGGLLKIARDALNASERKIPIKLIIVGIRGDIKSEQWIL